MYKSTELRWCTVLLLILMALAPVVAIGAGLPDKIVTCDGVDCKVCDVATTAQNVLNMGIFVTIFLSAVLFAWAGWKHVTAGGDSGKVGEARRIFTNVGIGLVLILAAWLIVDTLMKTLTNGSFGPWNKVCELFAQHFLA